MNHTMSLGGRRLYDVNTNKKPDLGSSSNSNSSSSSSRRLYDVNSNKKPEPDSSPSSSNVFDFGNTSDYGSSNSIVHDTQDGDHHEETEARHEIEYSRAPDTFPCGHVLCHNCVRKFMRLRQRSGYSRCPVCHRRLDEDVPLYAMGLAVNTPATSPTSPSSYSGSSFRSSPTSSPPQSPTSPSDPTPISLLSNFDEIVKRFNGINHGLRRLKDESVRSKSMGMTFTNTQCHLCMENHGTLRVVQEYNHLAVKHERPNLWSNYFYRLQQGKIVTEFYSQVNSSCICVPCTYRELQEKKHPDMKALPKVDPNKETSVCLAEVGKIMAKNLAPIMSLRGKNIIEIDHKVQLRERADHFDFQNTVDEIERQVRNQESMLLNIASRQIRDTGRLYHVKESNSMEMDMDETDV